jgi:hypothetical protein
MARPRPARRGPTASSADATHDAPRYQALYCEENVYHLCSHPAVARRSPAAVFIRGAGAHCVMWHQRLSQGPGAPVVWDYHVVLLARDPWQIWDLDSTLARPLGAATYLRRSLRPELRLRDDLVPWLRVVDAAELVATFASDRSHMRTADGGWQAPPPPWPAIGEGSTLARFLDRADTIAGEVLTVPALLARVGAAHG